MALSKGGALEELVRAYFARQGFFAVRSVPYRFDGEEVTDLDVWLYSKQTASARIRAIVDVKNKRSPKALERVLWVKGIQMALDCDFAFVATTDANPRVARFANSQKIQILSKGFLDRLESKLSKNDRLTLEDFNSAVKQYEANKHDGDWLEIIAEAKSSVACSGGFQAFNKTMLAFRFFGERAEVRLQHRDVALRCALHMAALSCVALDSGLERVMFEDGERRYISVLDGINFGDDGDGKAQTSIRSALDVLCEGLPNGRTLAANARKVFDQQVADIRADIIAEYFVREHNAQHLFAVAKELDEAAHERNLHSVGLSLEARSILGIFADYMRVKRTVLPIANTQAHSTPAQDTVGVATREASKNVGRNSEEKLAEAEAGTEKQQPTQKPLL